MTGIHSIIRTKLNPPHTPANLVLRERLSQLLDRGLRPECRLMLISAPAGYGKSTLVATWLARLRSTHAWLSLEEADNDPVRFLMYVGAALERVAPEFLAYVGSLAEAHQLPEAGTIAAEMINAMLPSPSPILLTMDDYHVITHPYPHDVVRHLLKHQPPNFHLILVTREDPPFPVNRMRVHNEMAEVRMKDLRFTAEEAEEFLRSMGLVLRDGAVAYCVARTEGWAAGLQLAALSLQGCNPEQAEAFLSSFSGSHRYIIDYLVDEVLGRQDPPVREFLRRTSVLERFSPSLCDAVTGRDDSLEVLREIEAKNLFLISLDGEREWFRYHHLFADSLRGESTEIDKADLHRRAARWFESRGDLPEAVRQALLAGEHGEAARLISAAATEMLLRGEHATLRDWLEILPGEVVCASDDLIAVKPWVLCLTGRIREAGDFLAQISGTRRAGLNARNLSLILRLEATLASHRGDNACAVDLAHQALQLIDEKDDPVSRASTLAILGQNVQRLGDVGGAELAFREACTLVIDSPRTLVSVEATLSLCYLLGLRGRRREAEMICRRHYQAILDGGNRPLAFGGILAMQLGVLSYDANELVAARNLFETGVELSRAVSLHWDAQGEERLALTLDALGEYEAALEVLRGVHRPEDSVDAIFSSTAVEAEIRRRHGEIDAVQRWAAKWSLAPGDPPNGRRELGYLTYIRLLLDLEQPEQALILLSGFISIAKQMGRLNRLIALWVLRALALEALGRREEAVAALRPAVAMAAPEGYIRAFLDQGPAVAGLLPLVRDTAPTFVDGLLTSFRTLGAEVDDGRVSLPEPLTDRECELLKLLAVGLSNEEISRLLHISPNTTKWHLRSIFGKLAVVNRTQAAVRAKELGISG